MSEITIGTIDYDAFSDVDTADEYLTADVARATPWLALTTDSKGRALVSATRMMLALPWIDTTPDPAVIQSSPIPDVCAMLAADLAANPKLFADASGDTNVKVAKAGSASVEFFSPVSGGPPIPKALWNILLNADLVGSIAGATDVTLDGPQPFGTSDSVRPLSGRYPWDWPIASGDYD